MILRKVGTPVAWYGDDAGFAMSLTFSNTGYLPLALLAVIAADNGIFRDDPYDMYNGEIRATAESYVAMYDIRHITSLLDLSPFNHLYSGVSDTCICWVVMLVTERWISRQH